MAQQAMFKQNQHTLVAGHINKLSDPLFFERRQFLMGQCGDKPCAEDISHFQ